MHSGRQMANFDKQSRFPSASITLLLLYAIISVFSCVFATFPPAPLSVAASSINGD